MGGLARGKRGREREEGEGEGEGEEAWSVSLTFGGPTNPLDPYVVRRMLHETVSLKRIFNEGGVYPYPFFTLRCYNCNWLY